MGGQPRTAEQLIARAARRSRGIVTPPRHAPEGPDRPPRHPDHHRAATLLRLASLLSFENLTRAVHEADVRSAPAPEGVEAALRRHPNITGANTLRRVVHGDAPVTLGELERRFLALLTAHHLPLPLTNRLAGTNASSVDWPDHALAVELDSYRGESIRRYTWRDVVEDPGLMLAELRGLIQPYASPSSTAGN